MYLQLTGNLVFQQHRVVQQRQERQLLLVVRQQRELQLLSGELLVHRALRKLSVAVLTLIMGYC